MSHVTHPKISLGTRRPRHVPRTAAPAARTATVAEPASTSVSLAAPLTLAAVVVGDLVLAVTVAAVSALGG